MLKLIYLTENLAQVHKNVTATKISMGQKMTKQKEKVREEILNQTAGSVILRIRKEKQQTLP